MPIFNEKILKRQNTTFNTLTSANKYLPPEYLDFEKQLYDQSTAQLCPRCKGETNYRKNMFFYISNCSHKLCNFCYDNLFFIGDDEDISEMKVSAENRRENGNIYNKNFIKCYVQGCNTQLNKNSYVVQQFEDISLHKKLSVRQKILKEFEKSEQHFNSIDAFEDYLENLEDYVYNRLNSIEDEELEKTMQKYKRLKKNDALVEKNMHKFSYEMLADIVAKSDLSPACIYNDQSINPELLSHPDFSKLNYPQSKLFTFPERDFPQAAASQTNQFYAGGCDLHSVYYKAYLSLFSI